MDWLNTNSTTISTELVGGQSAEWHASRKRGIGSSDIPVILGVSPFKSILQLWLEKTGQKEDDFKGNWATRRGNELEPMVRRWYNATHGCNTAPLSYEMSNEIFRANCDGIDTAKNILIEIKCPGRSDHEKAISGIVPDKYLPQVHWLMMVFSMDSIDYISFNQDFEELKKFAIVKITKDQEYQDLLKAKALEFWDHVVNKTKPPGAEEVIINDPMLSGLLIENQWITEQIEKLKERQDKVLDQIKGMAKESKSICGDFTLSWHERKGAIEYAKIPEINSLNLDQYRKPSSMYFTIKKNKSIEKQSSVKVVDANDSR